MGQFLDVRCLKTCLKMKTPQSGGIDPPLFCLKRKKQGRAYLGGTCLDFKPVFPTPPPRSSLPPHASAAHRHPPPPPHSTPVFPAWSSGEEGNLLILFISTAVGSNIRTKPGSPNYSPSIHLSFPRCKGGSSGDLAHQGSRGNLAHRGSSGDLAHRRSSQALAC